MALVKPWRPAPSSGVASSRRAARFQGADQVAIHAEVVARRVRPRVGATDQPVGGRRVPTRGERIADVGALPGSLDQRGSVDVDQRLPGHGDAQDDLHSIHTVRW